MAVMISRRTRPALRLFEELAGLHYLDRGRIRFGRLGEVEARVPEGDLGVEGAVGFVGLDEVVVWFVKLALVYTAE